jgi:hypothetical protein
MKLPAVKQEDIGSGDFYDVLMAMQGKVAKEFWRVAKDTKYGERGSIKMVVFQYRIETRRHTKSGESPFLRGTTIPA